jgi:hypothetical protein
MATLADYNYYEEQISKVDHISSNDRMRLKIETESGKSTNWLPLNDQSAEVLIKFLRDNYNVR